ncbi:MAG: CcmD family protein [Pedobacter sp.]|nr:MAG: CcmD family protein [Pedobacter sp.]
MKKILLFFFALFLSFSSFAQGANVDMADALRANGKIYIVVICVAIILIGMVVYLFAIDRRLKMLEKKESSKN